MSKRQVKTPGAAMARTTRPITASDGLENVIAGLGTNRDKATYSTFGMPRVLQRAELEWAYRGTCLASKIVNCVADDLTREWRQIYFDDDDIDNQLAVEQAERDFSVQDKFNEAIRWSRLYGGSVIVIGVNDGNDLAKPLNMNQVQQGGLRYLHVLDRWRITPTGQMTTDLDSPNFGLPDSYLIAESSVIVHHTRVLRFDGRKLPYFSWIQNARWHDSEIQHVMDSLVNHSSVNQWISSMLFESNVDVVVTKGLTDLVSQKDGDAKALKRWQLASLLKSNNRMLLLDEGDKYEKKTNSFANLDKLMQEFRTEVSAAADIPVTRLFGQSPGGLNSTGDNDIRNYYDMVRAKQESELRPKLEYLDQILMRHALGFVPDDYRFDFNSLWQLSEVDKSKIELDRANRDQIYLNLGVVTEVTIAKDLKETGTYKNLTNEHIESIDELSKPLQGVPNESGLESVQSEQ